MNTKGLSEQDSEIVLATLLNRDDFNNQKKIATLTDVHNTFKKWFHLQDMNRIDVVLAVALSQKMEGSPLWLILVSRSGDMKSEQVLALDDNGVTTKMIHRFTDKTLVNGNPDKTEAPDLAPKLNGKIMLFSDFAEILQLRADIKSEVWAQLRNLYDGMAGVQSGMGTDILYKDLRVTFIAASTPALDEQILIHQSLGTREFIYRPKEIVDVEKMMEMAWENEAFEEIMRQELKAVCQNFLKNRPIKKYQIPDELKKRIKALARYLSIMRASAPSDSYSGELRGFVWSEQPTRILKQLKKLFITLKCLDDNYNDEKAMEILTEVVMSSVDVMRQKVLATLFDKTKKTTNEIVNELKIGRKTVLTELYVLWHLGIINREAIEFENNYTHEMKIVQENWEINQTYILQDILLTPNSTIGSLSIKENIGGGWEGLVSTIDTTEYTSDTKEHNKEEKQSDKYTRCPNDHLTNTDPCHKCGEKIIKEGHDTSYYEV